MAPTQDHHATSSTGQTAQLSRWIANLQLDSVPPDVLARAKHLVLDGLGCAFVGAQLPWSARAVSALLEMDPQGPCTVIGWGSRTTTPMTAALLNSSFIQGFELDDYHYLAPLHSNSIVLPALLATAEHLERVDPGLGKISGAEFLLATIVGYEVGPRVGLALHGGHMLTRGWHSGAVFGPPAAAAATSKLANLSVEQIEDALGTACTQAGGLMSAQFGSDAKRMQHGFAARSGLLGTLLARKGYTGIKAVFETKYGGFLAMFGQGSAMEPEYLVDEVTKGLGSVWQTENIRVKPYAAMAGTHCTVDCLRALQEKYPEMLRRDRLKNIRSIRIEMGQAAFNHGGWSTKRPLTATGAQMSNAFVAATQLVDRHVSPAEFRHDKLERDEIWHLLDRTECSYSTDFDVKKYGQRVIITFTEGSQQPISQTLGAPKGVLPGLTNEDIAVKWRTITKGVIDDERRDRIEYLVARLESVDDIRPLISLLKDIVKNPIA